MLLNHRTIYATLFYTLIVVLVAVWKPSFAFEEDGSIKAFGLGPHKSVISFGVTSGMLAVWSFYAFMLIDFAFQRKVYLM